MLVLAAAAGAALVSAGYQCMSPTGQWFGRAFSGARHGQKKIALTFDDGPNDPHTLNLLDVLARENVRATFFLLGRYVRQRPDIAAATEKAADATGTRRFQHPKPPLR